MVQAPDYSAILNPPEEQRRYSRTFIRGAAAGSTYAHSTLGSATGWVGAEAVQSQVRGCDVVLSLIVYGTLGSHLR